MCGNTRGRRVVGHGGKGTLNPVWFPVQRFRTLAVLPLYSPAELDIHLYGACLNLFVLNLRLMKLSWNEMRNNRLSRYFSLCSCNCKTNLTLTLTFPHMKYTYILMLISLLVTKDVLKPLMKASLYHSRLNSHLITVAYL